MVDLEKGKILDPLIRHIVGIDVRAANWQEKFLEIIRTELGEEEAGLWRAEIFGDETKHKDRTRSLREHIKDSNTDGVEILLQLVLSPLHRTRRQRANRKIDNTIRQTREELKDNK